MAGPAPRIPLKARLVDYLRDQARWRREKAEEYPDDPRNRKWAENLEGLAAEVDSVSSDHPDLRVLDALHEPYGLDVFQPGESGQEILKRHERYSPPDVHAFLGELASAEAGDAMESDHEEER